MKCPSIHKLFDGEIVFEMIWVDELEKGNTYYFQSIFSMSPVYFSTLPNKDMRTVLRSNHIDLLNDGVTNGIQNSR